MLVLLRTIFARCKLVHADFSEYNVLYVSFFPPSFAPSRAPTNPHPPSTRYHDSHLWVIDVSQSVEQDHPHAFDFLRSDIRNADDFFARRGVDTLGLTRTFAYVTRKGEPESDEEMLVEAERVLALAEAEEGGSDDEGEGEDGKATTTKPSALDEAVFAQSYIPRALDQVYDPERDVARVLRGEGGGLIYADITGVAKIQKGEKDKEVPGPEGGAVEGGGKKGKGKGVRFGAEDDFEQRPNGGRGDGAWGRVE